MKTREAAVGRWHGILMHFGIAPEFLRNKQGPCPVCGGRDRWRFDDKGGLGTFYCNHCGAGDGFKLLELWTGRGFKELADEVDGIVGNIEVKTPAPKTDPVKRLKKLQRGAISVDGINPVRRYLKSRGLSPTRGIEFNPRVTYWEDGERVGDFPAMLCKLVSPDGIPMTYHVTHLTPDGKKAPVSSPRKICPPAGDLSGCAIRLSPIASHIGIAEGVETALAAAAMFGIPTWACANAPLLEQFTPPEGVEKVTIYGDNDYSYTGQAAAYVLAKRLARMGIAADVVIPRDAGTDFADVYLNGREATA